jgi:outer membrane protein OmpA-like peptidoglycan-associated protein
MRILNPMTTLLVLGTVLFMSGCGAVRQLSPTDSDRAAAIGLKISQAQQMDAKGCAPQELAKAEAKLDYARHEAMEYHDAAATAQDFAEAEAAADALMAKTEACWKAKQDKDGDGVPDYRDRCPGTAKGSTVDAVGCAIAAGPPDSDGDGVPDYRDRCPDTSRGAAVDAVGCPSDTDRDGLSDWDETTKHKTDPNNPDTDGGGVNDGLEVVIAGTDPLNPKDDVKELKCVELEMQFDFDKAVVKPRYYSEVERVADYLKDYPELNVVVQGHTDNVGATDYNLDLSLRRAKNVVKLLTEKYRIDPARLKAEGYGASQPIASNATEAGRAKNRRIYAILECE